MCILIMQEAGHTITKKVLRRCFDANPNGAGMAYINTDYAGVSRVRIKKNMKFNKFYARLRHAESNNPNSPFIIHFRITTHGGTRVENNHPFKINKKTVFAHNGILSEMGRKTIGNESDTRAFNRLILRTLPKGWQDSPGITTMMEDFIVGSKMAVLNTDYTYKIYREHMGEWVGGAWFSNGSYKERVPYKAPPYKGAGKVDKNWGRGKGWGQSAYKAPSKYPSSTAKGKSKGALAKDIPGASKFTPKVAPVVNPPAIVLPDTDSVVNRLKLVQNAETKLSEVHRKCDCCGVFHALCELCFYKVNSFDAECYCGDCAETMLKNYIVNDDEELTYAQYLDIVDTYQYSKKYDSTRSDSLDYGLDKAEYMGD